MDREFTRKELYDLVWSQPMRTLAAMVGISDVALAKHCRKAKIPVPTRGYWARKQALRPTIQVKLPPRFPGASDRIGGLGDNHYYWGSQWPEKFRQMEVPPAPVFDEEMSSVMDRARKMVGKVRCPRNFDIAHPLVAKLLAHDEERRREFLKWGSSYYAPKYDAGTERRRLLILNAIFVAAARLGCRPAMNTSKYGQEGAEARAICIRIGESHVDFTVEPVKSKTEGKKERLRLAFGTAQYRVSSAKFWEDDAERSLEDQLSDVLGEMLVSAEASYRTGLVQHREWIIERKAAAEAEIKRRQDEGERTARELEAKLARERIGRLLAQAKAFDRANQIRAYVDAALSRAAALVVALDAIATWAAWAREQADAIDPVKNGTVARAIEELKA